MADLGAIGREVVGEVLHRPVASPRLWPVTYHGGLVDFSPLAVDIGGSISGIAKIGGVPTAGATMALYHRGTKEMIALAVTAGDGSYSFDYLDRYDEHGWFVVMLDPENDGPPYNKAEVLDRMSAG